MMWQPVELTSGPGPFDPPGWYVALNRSDGEWAVLVRFEGPFPTEADARAWCDIENAPHIAPDVTVEAR